MNRENPRPSHDPAQAVPRLLKTGDFYELDGEPIRRVVGRPRTEQNLFEVLWELRAGAIKLLGGELPDDTYPDEPIRRLEAMATWGEGAGAESTAEELSVTELGALRVNEDFSLDVFTLMRVGVLDRNRTYDDVAADAQRRTLRDGVEVVYASIPRLLDLQAGTGRPKDELDIIVLTEINRGVREARATDLATVKPDLSVKPSDPNQGHWSLEASPGD